MAPKYPSSPVTTGIWSEQEHEQFLRAMKLYPRGPWRSIAAVIGTRSIKQVQTHAQKYQQKLKRRQRGLRKQKKKFVRLEHRVDLQATGSIQRPHPSTLEVRARAPVNLRKIHISDLPSTFFKSESCDSPRSPASFHSKECGEAARKDVDLEKLLEDVEPVPFTSLPCDYYFMTDTCYRRDVEESLAILLS